MAEITLHLIPKPHIIFPYQPIRLVIPSSSSFFNKHLTGKTLGLCFHKGESNEEPSASSLHEIGVFFSVTGEITQYEPGNSQRGIKAITGTTTGRFKITKLLSLKPPFTAEVKRLVEVMSEAEDKELNESGTIANAKALAKDYISLLDENEAIKRSKQNILAANKSIPFLFSTIVSYLKASNDIKYKLLELDSQKERFIRLIQILKDELALEKTKSDILKKTHEEIQNDMRKEALRRQVGQINKELYGSPADDLAKIKEKLEKGGLPQEALEVALQELSRLQEMNTSDAEYTVQRKYVEVLAGLPWSKTSKEIGNISYAETVLNRDHAGLDKIKRRILEFIAVKMLKKNSKGTILCFQGPPGVGKTSLGKSIAESLGRKFERISLGGISDEAEIRGHRRTYIGAMPGVFIEALMKCQTNNPVILLDEIDKIGRNSTGDPSSALLEVLDPNQNASFKDHYLGVQFDLSNILFLATANTVHNLPAPLLDRMEIISLSGYTADEKVEIAVRHLIPRQIHENGLREALIEIPEPSIRFLIEYYTSEAGVRTLERTIGSLCRKVAFQYLKVNQAKDTLFRNDVDPLTKSCFLFETVKVTEQFIEEELGPAVYDDDIKESIDQPGIAIGMAWTPVGGKLLLIEASKSKGKGKLEITGKLGDVMKESVMTAIGWIKAHYNLIALILGYASWTDDGRFKDSKHNWEIENYDIHVHFPAAAIPKDGPSAGVTITIALISLLTAQTVRNDIAMTGEISLKGCVLPVGGVKEKCLAAYAKGIRRVIIPEKNKHDMEEIPKEIKENMRFYFVRNLSEVIALAFEPKSQKMSGLKTTLGSVSPKAKL